MSAMKCLFGAVYSLVDWLTLSVCFGYYFSVFVEEGKCAPLLPGRLKGPTEVVLFPPPKKRATARTPVVSLDDATCQPAIHEFLLSSLAS